MNLSKLLYLVVVGLNSSLIELGSSIKAIPIVFILLIGVDNQLFNSILI